MAYNAWNSNRNTPNNDQTGGWDGSGGITPLDDGQRSSPPMGVHPPPQAWGQQPPGYPGQFGAPPPGQPPYPGHQGRFGEFQQRVMPAISPEDIVILRECGIESLLYRCLPLTATFCSALMFAARSRNFVPRFYHYMGAVGLGYFIGKVSYRGACEKKLINSKSNSPFVNAIRKRYGMFTNEFPNYNADMGSNQSADWTTDMERGGGGGGRRGIAEFDDEGANRGYGGWSGQPGGHHSTPDNQLDFGLQDDSSADRPPPQQPGTTYDELRQRNRANFKSI